MAKHTKFITYEKLSKKKQQEIAKARRGSWGLVKPATKVKESAKLYKRSKTKQDVRRHQNGSSASILFYFFIQSICHPLRPDVRKAL